MADLKFDENGRFEFRGRTYELTRCSGGSGFSLELDDVSTDDRTTLLIGRRLDSGEVELLSLENLGKPARQARFLPVQLVEFFLGQLAKI